MTVKFSIEVSGEEQEILISELSDLGADGFEQEDVLLHAYFNSETLDEAEVLALIEGRRFSKEVLEDRNWNAVWESNFDPVIVDDFCGIRANFHASIPNVHHEIEITPKMSFGTGHHATTHMMIAAMKGIDFKGKKVCDLGTGTGVLAILASMLGAASVTAIDNDPWSVTNAIENVAMNNVSVEVSEGEQIPPSKFDVILANINRNILLQNMQSFAESTTTGADLLLSGILEDDVEAITKSAESEGFQLRNKWSRKQWVCIHFVRNAVEINNPGSGF